MAKIKPEANGNLRSFIDAKIILHNYVDQTSDRLF
jgi:hypothetical protein